MKKTLTKIMSVIMAIMIAVTCMSVAFADSSNYTYVCSKCGETVEVTSGIDMHSMFCDGNGSYCDICGEIIYGGTVVFSVHRATCSVVQMLKKITVEIQNNPGETTLNYGDTLKLTATVLFEGEPYDVYAEGGSIMWSADSGAVKITSYGETCEVEAVKSGTATVTLNILDPEGKVLEGSYEDEDGNIHHVYTDSQTITVKAGFFEKLISFFKNLFGMDRTIVQ